MEPRAVAQRLAEAMLTTDPAVYARLVADDVIARVWGWDGSDCARGRELVARRLADDAAGRKAPRLEIFNALTDGDRVALELRIRAETDGAMHAHNRSMFVTVAGGRATHIDLYCAEPIPCERDHDWIAPASISDADVERLIDEQRFAGDARAWITVDRHSHTSKRCKSFGSTDPSPQRNQIRAARWATPDADREIDALIELHRARGLGFSWHVGGLDEPADLAERLVARGFVRAEPLSSMVLRLDDAPPIPVDTDVRLEAVDGSDPINSEQALQVLGAAFSWDHDQIEAARAWWLPRLRGILRPYPQRFYLARLGGRPVGFGALALGGGAADLSGAGTIPEARSRGVYTALLAKRLDDARAHGYHIVTVGTTPMSRRVVCNYGFVELGVIEVYEWTPAAN